MTRPARGEAHIAFDRGLLGAYDAAELVARLRKWERPFAFGPVVTVPEPHWILVPPAHPERPLEPAEQGLAVTLPEWTASAVGWVLARVLATARVFAPEVRRCALRVSRVG